MTTENEIFLFLVSSKYMGYNKKMVRLLAVPLFRQSAVFILYLFLCSFVLLNHRGGEDILFWMLLVVCGCLHLILIAGTIISSKIKGVKSTLSVFDILTIIFLFIVFLVFSERYLYAFRTIKL